MKVKRQSIKNNHRIVHKVKDVNYDIKNIKYMCGEGKDVQLQYASKVNLLLA